MPTSLVTSASSAQLAQRQISAFYGNTRIFFSLKCPLTKINFWAHTGHPLSSIPLNLIQTQIKPSRIAQVFTAGNTAVKVLGTVTTSRSRASAQAPTVESQRRYGVPRSPECPRPLMTRQSIVAGEC